MQDYREFLDEIIISEEALQQRIKALGAEISQDFAGKKLHLICILRGEGKVVGSIYVGARESSFLRLVNSFNRRVAIIALICIVLAGIIAVPISRIITRPIDALVKATKKLAQGDMSVRVKTDGKGEFALLGNSFNSMVETLYKTEKELLHKEKLASMGQLAAGVAHEINNPLGTILLFADVMSKELPDGDPRRDDLNMISRETLRCKKIVADLLNFARQQELLAQDTDLHELLEQVINGVRHQDSFKNVAITRGFSKGPLMIQADQSQLMQVFVNLLNNAAAAMSGGGTITIATRLLQNGFVEVTVADTGCGIADEHLDKIFTPFFTTKPWAKERAWACPSSTASRPRQDFFVRHLLGVEPRHP